MYTLNVKKLLCAYNEFPRTDLYDSMIYKENILLTISISLLYGALIYSSLFTYSLYWIYPAASFIPSSFYLLVILFKNRVTYMLCWPLFLFLIGIPSSNFPNRLIFVSHWRVKQAFCTPKSLWWPRWEKL